MDFMLILQIVVLLGAIFLGVRLGGIGIGYAGGLGVLVLGLCLGMKPGNIPWDVILIIASVIAAISCMQLAGGLDYLVQIAERVLRANPKQINYLAPIVTYVLTIFAGTGHTAFSMIPVIVEVAKEQKIRPCCPLSIAVVASQIAITASPVSAAVIYMSGVLEPFGWSYPALLGIWLVTTFAGCMLTAFVMTFIQNMDLESDSVYKERLAKGLVKKSEGVSKMQLKPHAKLSVLIFLLGVVCVVLYASAISPAVGLIKNVVVPRDAAIMSLMLTVATLTTIFCKVELGKVADTSVFKSGMVACVCVLGVAWRHLRLRPRDPDQGLRRRRRRRLPGPARRRVLLRRHAALLAGRHREGDHPGHRRRPRHHVRQPRRLLHARRLVRGRLRPVRPSDLPDAARRRADG